MAQTCMSLPRRRRASLETKACITPGHHHCGWVGIQAYKSGDHVSIGSAACISRDAVASVHECVFNCSDGDADLHNYILVWPTQDANTKTFGQSEMSIW
jgi:hypothetical protein